MEMLLDLLGVTCDDWESWVPNLEGLGILYKGLFYTAKAISGFHTLKLICLS